MAEKKVTTRTNTKKRSGSASGKATSGAARKKTASAKRQASGRSADKKRKPIEREQIDYALTYEIFLWIVIALAVLVFISLLGLGGFVGKFFSDIMFGLFGVMAYAFPFILIFLTAFLIANNQSRIARIKAASVAGLFITICGWAQVFSAGYSSSYQIGEYYTAGSEFHAGGGLIGGGLTHFFASGIGIVGSAIIYVFLTIIFVILITQKSIFANVKKGGKNIYRNARHNREERRAWNEQKRLEREERLVLRGDSDTLYDPSAELAMSGTADEQSSFTLLSKEPRTNRKISGVTKKTQLFPSFAMDSDAEQNAAKDVSNELKLDEEPAAMQVLRGSVQKTRGGSRKRSDAKTMPVTEKTYPASSVNEPEDNKEPEPIAMPSFLDEAILMRALGGNENSGEKEAEENEVKEDHIPEKDKMPVPEKENEPAKENSVSSAKAPRKIRSSQEEIEAGIEDVAAQIAQNEQQKPEYVFPTLDLLSVPSGKGNGSSKEELLETSSRLQQVFKTFGVNVKITNVTCGPSVTRYELSPEMGVKVSKIVNLQDDIKLNLAATDIRIEAPIPGKAAVGIEIPNKKPTGVVLRELLESEEFRGFKSNLAYAVGKDISGKIIVSDIAKMPHLLIAGATGSGKSVFINTLIMSILYKAKPEDVKMIMIDPKVVELSVYNGIPHLFIPVVTDPKKAAGALNWAVAEMMNRYQKFEEAKVRDLKSYNKKIANLGDDVPEDTKPEKLPQIVIIVDELADLMMVASAEVEDAICRLAQLARAAGIHLVIATQRPSVDVITGLIKANMPSRIAFSVSSGVDSRTVLDSVGAEKLLGNGDMLFAPQNFKQPVRVQGAYVSDGEVSEIVDFIKEHNAGEHVQQELQARMDVVAKSSASAAGGGSDTDELFAQAGKFIIEKDKASIGMLQRWFKIGFNRAARIMDQLSDAGVVGPEEGTKPRKVLMSEEQFENYLEQN